MSIVEARGWGEAVARGRYRVSPADFEVTEILGFAADGEGEHLLVEVEKTGQNTAWVAGQLARWAGVAPMAVGYAGMKDRHAVTRQHFSLQLPGREAPDASTLAIEGVRLLSMARHRRKLPRGAHRGNAFRLVLRGVEGERAAIDARLARIAEGGFPNRFGEQRFGRDAGNLERARAMFAGRRVGRAERGMLLSAARSALFNAVLARRLGEGSWARGMPGEVWQLDGRGTVFGPQDPDAELAARLERLEIHPTGPLWGRGPLPTAGAAAALESDVASGFEDVTRGLEQAGLRQERRALRAAPRELAWRWQDEATLELRFTLGRGCYATALLQELGEFADAGGAGE